MLISFALFWRRIESREKGSTGYAIASLLGLLPKGPTELPLRLQYPWQFWRGGSLLFRPIDALDVWNCHSDVIEVSGRTIVTVTKQTWVNVLTFGAFTIASARMSQTQQSSLRSSFCCAMTPGRSLSYSSRSFSMPPSLTTPQFRRCTIGPITWAELQRGFSRCLCSASGAACNQLSLLVPPAHRETCS